MLRQVENQFLTITLPNLQTINYQYDNAGNLSQISYPNGAYTTYGYDTRNRLTGLSNNNIGGIISQYSYTLDGIGNRTSIIQQEPLTPVPNSVPTDYSYSTGNILTTANGTSSTTSYGYDNNGNLTSKTQGSNTTAYGYDSLNRLTSFLSPSFNIQYQYDGMNNRVSKTVNGTTTNYLVDSNGYLPLVVEEMDGSGNITSYYVHDRESGVAKITSSGSIYYYHYNGLGSTIAITDSNGNMVNKYAYDEFGNILSQQETIYNPFKYVGRFGVMDERNGLLYMRARYYDPGVGRFINKDPIGLVGGMNLYGYVTNPMNWIDPWGLDPIDPRTGKDNPILRCHAVTHNDPTENLYGAMIMGGVATGLIFGPEVPVAYRYLYYWMITTFYGNPTLYKNSVDVLQGYLTPGPPSTKWGNVGTAVRLGYDWAYYNWQLHHNSKDCDSCTQK